MHLLSAQAGALQQEGEAIDLAQSPAPLIFASAADSELMMLAGAADRAGTSDLRLANLLRLSHNLSVDLWLEQTVQHAKLVVVRLLGGPAFWRALGDVSPRPFPPPFPPRPPPLPVGAAFFAPFVLRLPPLAVLRFADRSARALLPPLLTVALLSLLVPQDAMIAHLHATRHSVLPVPASSVA
ncbi:hypothetical protein, partial [Devosia insulae]|uniref:hypothetical protein n=1 Tax=Devosia insulae TaxID=408174 RepID=UPI00114CCC24